VNDTQDQRHRAYAAKALQGQCDTVSAGGKGSRDDDLNAAAFAVGTFLPNYPLSESEATAALLEAIGPHLGGDQGEQWARRKIARGLKDGARHPRPALDSNYTPPRLASEAPRVRTARPEPAPEYRPQQDVDGIWYSAKRVDDAAGTEPIKWLVRRGIDAATVGKHDLAREILEDGSLPGWAWVEGLGDWYTAGFRLVIPMHDADGVRRSIRARHTGETDPPGRKSTAAKYRGCAMANPPALELLRGQGGPSTVVIAEGEPDYLTAATTWPTCAVFGIVAGSWKPEHAQRIPDGSTVLLYTDADATGESYADKIRRTFAGRNVKLRPLARIQ